MRWLCAFLALIGIECGAAIRGNLVAEGDSITAMTAVSNGYAFIGYKMFSNASTYFTNFGLSGSRFDLDPSMTNRASTVDSIYTNGIVNVESVLIGINDLGGKTPAAVTSYVNEVKGYFLARKSVGFKMVICTSTIVSTSSYPTMIDQINLYNATIRGDSSWYDGIADFGADPIMGNWSNGSNTTYYADGLHPTGVGHYLLALVYTNAVVPLLFSSDARIINTPTINAGRIIGP